MAMPVLTMELIALTSFILSHGHDGRQSSLGKAQSLVILILRSSFFLSREATGGLFAWLYSFPLQASVCRQQNLTGKSSSPYLHYFHKV